MENWELKIFFPTVMLIYNFTNPNLIPSGIKFFQTRKINKSKGRLIEELKECEGGRGVIDALLEKGWKVKDIFFEMRKKRKKEGEYFIFRVKVILVESGPKEGNFPLSKIDLLSKMGWEYCRIFENPAEKNLTVNFAHTIFSAPKFSIVPKF